MTTLDPATAGAGAVLSNGDLSMTQAVTNFYYDNARSTTARSGKRCFKLTIDSWTGGFGSDAAFGICSEDWELISDDWAGDFHNNSVGDWHYAAYMGNDDVLPLSGEYDADQTLLVAVNTNAKLIWFKHDDNDWNYDPSANPTTGVGGLDYSSTTIDGAVYAAFTIGSYTADEDAPAFTADFSPTDLPTGFLAWDSSPDGPFYGNVAIAPAEDRSVVVVAEDRTVLSVEA